MTSSYVCTMHFVTHPMLMAQESQYVMKTGLWGKMDFTCRDSWDNDMKLCVTRSLSTKLQILYSVGMDPLTSSFCPSFTFPSSVSKSQYS